MFSTNVATRKIPVVGVGLGRIQSKQVEDFRTNLYKFTVKSMLIENEMIDALNNPIFTHTYTYI